MSQCNNFEFSDDYLDKYMNQTNYSYSEYKSNHEEAKLQYLIQRKYLKLLGKFIENMYSDLKFDVFIRHRNPKVKHIEWYGYTYMELRIFDVITVYNPMNFNPTFKTPNSKEDFNGETIYNLIESFIPEINKHLLISFRPPISPHIEIHNVSFYEIPDYECWSEHFKREYMKDASTYHWEDFQTF